MSDPTIPIIAKKLSIVSFFHYNLALELEQIFSSWLWKWMTEVWTSFSIHSNR